MQESLVISKWIYILVKIIIVNIDYEFVIDGAAGFNFSIYTKLVFVVVFP